MVTKKRKARSKGATSAPTDLEGEKEMADAPEYNPTFSEINPEDIPSVTREGKAAKLINEFVESGLAAAKVQGHAKTFATSLKRAVKNTGAAVEVLKRGDSVILKRTDAEDNEPSYA